MSSTTFGMFFLGAEEEERHDDAPRARSARFKERLTQMFEDQARREGIAPPMLISDDDPTEEVPREDVEEDDSLEYTARVGPVGAPAPARFAAWTEDPVPPMDRPTDVGTDVYERMPVFVAPSEELLRVTHRVSAQFVDVIAMAASQLLGGHDVDHAVARIESALDALGRLARTADDEAHQALLDEMKVHLDQYCDAREDDRGHTRFRDALRSWLPTYAAHVGGETGDRLRDLVEFDMDDTPVFRHLQGLHGMGPRRLGRLYSAGLYTADVISQANADDMASVTGLPSKLAARVIEATHWYRAEMRRRTVLEMAERLRRFGDIVRTIGRDEDELRDAARTTRDVLRAVLNELEERHDLD